MKDFFAYFFGQGDTAEFSLFTPAHFAPILVMLAVIFLIRHKADTLRGWRHEEKIRSFFYQEKQDGVLRPSLIRSDVW